MTHFKLRTLKLRPGEQFHDEQQIELEPLEYGGERYVPVPEAVAAELAITRAMTGTVFELRFRARLHGPCQRCLGDAVVESSISGREYEASDPNATEEMRNPYLAENELDLSAWARYAVALSLPVQILCRPDCAGRCAICGKNLNVEPHEHDEERVDPRWAALGELRDRL